MNKRKAESIALFAAIGAVGVTAIWLSCNRTTQTRFVTAKELSAGVYVGDMTPVEVKLFERVANREASPCGDDVTLAESLFNPGRCPLAPRAGRFVAEKVMEDFNEAEISKAYVSRYTKAMERELPVDGSPRKGPENPEITLVVFTDFVCPFCYKAAMKIHELMRIYPDDIALVHKNYPLASHQGAELAARAAFAAMLQGKFWEMHDTIFSASGTPLERERIELMAEGLGLDMDKFREDLASPSATAAITADRKLGEQVGVKGTPAIFLNGREVEEGMSALDMWVEEEIIRSANKADPKPE